MPSRSFKDSIEEREVTYNGMLKVRQFFVLQINWYVAFIKFIYLLQHIVVVWIKKEQVEPQSATWKGTKSKHKMCSTSRWKIYRLWQE